MRGFWGNRLRSTVTQRISYALKQETAVETTEIGPQTRSHFAVRRKTARYAVPRVRTGFRVR